MKELAKEILIHISITTGIVMLAPWAFAAFIWAVESYIVYSNWILSHV